MATENPLNLDIECFHPPSDIEENVFNLLISYLPQCSSMTAQQVAEQISSHLLRDAASKRNFLWQVWDIMFRIADQLDYREEPMQRFIRLVKVLREQLGTILGAEEGIPGFSMMLCERWNSVPRAREKNINGLIAHFTNEGIYQGYYRAIAMICNGLERNDGRSRKKLHLKLRKLTIAHDVPTAAVYFVLCAPKIYEACRQRLCEDATPVGELWTGEPSSGYSVARWEFWRSRFVVLIDHPDATEDTRESCKAAIQAMDDAVSS